MKFLAKSLKVSNLLRKELMLRWSIANLFIFFNFKWWRIFSGLSLKFWFSNCFLNSFEKLFWNFEKKMYMCLLGVTVTDETKFFARKLSLNSQKLLILLIIFMASLWYPLSIRCKFFCRDILCQYYYYRRYRVWGSSNDHLNFPL